MQQDKVRWGILSTANIARKNWLAIRNSGNGVVVAVASRGLGRAQQFIDECQADAPMPGSVRALGSYEELLAMPEVEAVYIPLPTGLRKEWVIRAAQAGKHVLCEKPCAISSADLREMTEACARHGVQFMDGVMFMHSQRLARIHEVIASGAIGKVRRIASAFSFNADADFYANNIRGSREMEPFGCLGDLGWYCLRLAQCMTDFAEPRDVAGTIHAEKGPPGVPTEFSGELFYDSDVSVAFYCSFSTADEEWAVITGTEGVLRISDFVLPFYGADIVFNIFNAQLDIVGCRFNMETSRRTVVVAEYSHAHANAQETNMVREFARLARSGKLNNFWPEAAMKTQALMERCLDAARRRKKI
jgi:predicted dehydrogenase